MVKVKVVGDKLEISGIADDDLKNIKKIFSNKKKPYMYIMEVGFLVTNQEGEVSYEKENPKKSNNTDLYR